MKTIIFIVLGLLLLVGGIAIGIAYTYSPLGFPGTFAPPAPQAQNVVSVGMGELDASGEWLKDVNVYLVSFRGIKGNRNYSALIFVPHEGKTISIGQGQEFELYLEAKDLTGTQPIIINPHDFDSRTNPLVVKLIDEGPNASQSYKNAHGLILSSQPHNVQNY